MTHYDWQNSIRRWINRSGKGRPKNFVVHTEYVGLRASVQHRMLDEDMVSIEDARAREVLRKISSGEGLEADNFVKAWGGSYRGRLRMGAK